MILYKIKAEPQSSGYGLMARDSEGYCFVYSANTGIWHRSGSREIDFDFDHEAVYEPITAQEAATLISGVKPADSSMDFYVAKLRAQEAQWTRTSDELGIVPPDDPTRCFPHRPR